MWRGPSESSTKNTRPLRAILRRNIQKLNHGTEEPVRSRSQNQSSEWQEAKTGNNGVDESCLENMGRTSASSSQTPLLKIARREAHS